MVFRIVALSLWVASCATGQLLYTGNHPLGSKSQYHFQDNFGFGKYGHSEPTSSHHATHDAYGNKAGEFSYVKPDGTIHKTQYIADSLGYRVLSNDLPVGPMEVPQPHHHLRKRRSAYPYAGQSMMPQSEYLADTPEVSAAKMSHFQEHIKRGNYHIQSPSPAPAAPFSSWSTPATYQQQSIVPTSSAPSAYSSWYAPIEKQGTSSPVSFGATPYSSAWSTTVGSWPGNSYSGNAYSTSQSSHPIVTADGYLKDTPEVAQAKAAHFAEKFKVSKYNDYSYDAGTQVKPYEVPSTGYYPGVASANYDVTQFAGPAGQVTDTPEVSAAKASHFAEYAAALARNTDGSGSYVNSVPQHYSAPTVYSGVSNTGSYASAVPQHYSSPAVYSGVSGVPAETPEVAQAKAAHFAEYNRVAARRLKRSISYGTYPASTLPLVEPFHAGVHPLFLSHPTPIIHLPRSNVIHSPFASSYQLVA